MIEKLVEYLKNKKIIILGFGLEGYSTYRFIKKHIPEQKIYISDANPNFLEKYEDVKNDDKAQIVPQEQYLKGLNEYDIIMKTPGLSFKDIDTSEFIGKIKSQLELFLEFVEVYTIGVTGTKGKSTTSSLIYNVLKEQKDDVHLLGNIGVPLFDEIDRLNKNSVVVLELSSHQLEFVEVSPNIAIVLNLFEEHLDHYKSYEHYINAKLNIAKYQKKGDNFIYSIDNECLKQHVENIRNELKSNIFEISFNGNTKICKSDKLIIRDGINVKNESGDILYIDSDSRNILGEHNFNNIMFVSTVAKIMNLDMNKSMKSIYESKPLPHRMEFVCELNGVKYYNDSIATIPESTINGLETLKNVKTLIIGGKDRGIDYTKFAEYLNNTDIKNLICLPDTGWKIADMITNNIMKKHIVKDMYEAVKIAKQVTSDGEICLLSPAASSYGFFKNFKERGNLFKKLVNEN